VAPFASVIAQDHFIDKPLCGELLIFDTNQQFACASSKLSPPDFIGGFERLGIACVDGRVAKRSEAGRPKRTPDPHRAVAESDRAAPSDCRAGA
jgi:hypothetical protein